MNAPPVTLGTAGHVDHGKTWLVRALTGKDTDRLAEERARGISIELGYAPLLLPNGTQMSVVDVPGHERFVRTMVAGATGIDLFLLVVDAGEGPRAQTYEHLQILRLLGVEYGAVAVTKIDDTDSELVEVTVELMRDLLPATDIVPVSAVTGEGIPSLCRTLERVAARVGSRLRRGPARLYVDRVFTLPGVGTVVTGTLWSGTIAVGDTLEVAPSGFAARVRSVQVHDRPVEVAEAGQRVAAGLLMERRRRPRRGEVLITPGAYEGTFRLDIALDALSPLPDGTRLQVCHGTSSVPSRLRTMGEGYAQLRLEQSLVAARGDRVILRHGTTVGGGRVLDPHPPRRLEPSRAELLDTSDPLAILQGLVREPTRIEALRRLVSESDLDAGLGSLIQVSGWIFSDVWLEDVRTQAHARLRARATEPDPGLTASTLLGREPWVPTIVPLLDLETEAGKLYLPGHKRSAIASASAADVERALAGADLKPFHVDDRGLALRLERQGTLVRLGDGTVIGTAAYERARTVLLEECARAETITLARYRDLLGVSRRVAQLLLERLDSDRVTLRIGDIRRVRRNSAKS